ncbi:MAG TPA: MFS transporter [Jatrophihabitantaceae bacterium]
MSAPAAAPRSTFTSLKTRNFRLFATGQLVSNTGSWVQRIAQDWLVLSITGSATAVGITTALQFLPTLLFGLAGGAIADRYPKRRILLATQVGMASMATILAILTLSHQVQVWHVYLVAFGLGTVAAIDNPARQSFVNEMVGPEQLRNAVSINASVFQLGALIGPAISGLLINAVGSGYAFAVNAASYSASTTALLLMRERELNRKPRGTTARPRIRDGLRYVASRPDTLWPTVLVGVFGLFTTNLAVTLAAYAKSVYHSGASGYGLLTSVVAVGSLSGALISAGRARTRLRVLVAIAGTLAVLYMVAAAAPSEWTYCAVMVMLGAATLLMYTSANSTVQLAAGDAIRGRVMGVYLLVFIGSGAIGGPIIGYLDEHLGPRTGMLISGLVPALATVVVALKLARDSNLRMRPRTVRALLRTA